MVTSLQYQDLTTPPPPPPPAQGFQSKYPQVRINRRVMIIFSIPKNEGLCQTFLSQEFNSNEKKTEIDRRLYAGSLDPGASHENLYEKVEDINQKYPKSNIPPVDLFLQSKKTLSSLVLDSEFYENLQIVRKFTELYNRANILFQNQSKWVLMKTNKLREYFSIGNLIVQLRYYHHLKRPPCYQIFQTTDDVRVSKCSVVQYQGSSTKI